MASPRRNRRPRTVLILLVLASVTIITLDARGGLHRITSGLRSISADAFSPIRAGIDDVVEPIGSFLAGSVHYGAVRQQNQKLQAEVEQLRAERAAQQDNDQRLQQLSALLDLPFVGSLQSVAAEVTNQDASNFASTVQIGVGRDQGVQLGMPVVAGGAGGTTGNQGGLVGQVVQANHSSATVRLITDGRSSVGTVYGAGAGSLSVLNGQGAGKPLDADFVQVNTPLTVGEVFVTSGLQNATYPAGIPVARVVSHQNGTSATQESVTLLPEADLEHLRYVAVILWSPSP